MDLGLHLTIDASLGVEVKLSIAAAEASRQAAEVCTPVMRIDATAGLARQTVAQLTESSSTSRSLVCLSRRQSGPRAHPDSA